MMNMIQMQESTSQSNVIPVGHPIGHTIETRSMFQQLPMSGLMSNLSQQISASISKYQVPQIL
jgi:hypothetical protein